MMMRMCGPVGAVIITGLLSMPAMVWSGDTARAADVTPAADQKTDPKRQLEQLQRQLDQKKRQQESATKKERSVLDEMDGLNRRIQSSRQQIVSLDRQLRAQNKELDQLNGQIAQLQQSSAALERTVAARVRAIYVGGAGGEWAVLLGAQDYQDFTVRLDLLRRVAERENTLLTDYAKQRAELERQVQAQRDAAGRLNQSRADLAKNLADSADAKQKKRMLLASIRTEKQTATKTIAELEESAQQLQELLKRLEEAQRQKSQGQLAQAKGHLPWPQDGDVVALFGRQRHSQYNTTIFRRGIEIRSADGAPVKAVHQGVVAYADSFKGYGFVVVLDHGDHYYTLYAHLGKALVKTGQAVEQGQLIGEVGEAGVQNDYTLYFEVRHHGTAMDPLEWLQQRKGKG